MLKSIVTGPINGLIFIARKIDESVRQEQDAERQATMDELRKLHARFEAGELTEEDFAEQEENLLIRLEGLE